MRAFERIPTWQGLDDSQNRLSSCALAKSSFSIERVKVAHALHQGSKAKFLALQIKAV